MSDGSKLDFGFGATRKSDEDLCLSCTAACSMQNMGDIIELLRCSCLRA
jgi:hypothetical protein